MEGKETNYEYCESEAGSDDMLILEPEDWTEDEWETILKLFGMEEAEKIEISNYKIRALGIKKQPEPELDWDGADNYLKTMIAEYVSLGWAGRFGLDGVLLPLKRRFDNGERTKKLYDEIMRCE